MFNEIEILSLKSSGLLFQTCSSLLHGTSHLAKATAMAVSGSSEDEERLKALREFDEAKTGVKGLVDGRATSIPFFFRHSKPSFIPPPPPPNISVPIVDLSLPRDLMLSALLSAARQWGIFQLINHSVPVSILHCALSAVRSFHELPADDRSRYYVRGTASGVSYSSNIDLFRSAAASWRDTLQIQMGPTPLDTEKIPEVCRQELVAWDAEARVVTGQVMGMLAEGMGVEEERLANMTCLQGRLMACHYYPPCPEAQVTAGMVEHTDPSVLSLLLQDEFGGLQVRKEGENGEWWWVDVEPVPGAVVVNVGDLLQIISNDEYKSVEHRVLANAHNEARVSIAMFFNPEKRGESDFFGPLPELSSKERGPQYRNFTMNEFLQAFFSKHLASKSLLDHFRIHAGNDEI